MKTLIVSGMIFISQFALAANNSCNFTLPPGRSEIQVLQPNQFVEHNPNQAHVVYSCGAFVNDGSVVVTPTTQIVELASGSCALSAYPGLNYIIFCN